MEARVQALSEQVEELRNRRTRVYLMPRTSLSEYASDSLPEVCLRAACVCVFPISSSFFSESCFVPSQGSYVALDALAMAAAADNEPSPSRRASS